MIFPTILALIQVMHAFPGWGRLEDDINAKLVSLENSIDHQKQELHIQDIKFPTPHQAFIVYEIVEKNPE